MRVTKKMLRETVERIQGYYPDISIGWAYGKPRVYNADGSRELSPRLPTGQMDNWLHGFEKGFELAHYARNKEIAQMRSGDLSKTIRIEIMGGLLVDVQGLPDGWEYELCDWDNCSDCGTLDPNCEWCKLERER